jgi:hypothetical protein
VDARCRSCGAPLEPAYRFCPSCAAPTRSKLVEIFEGHALIADSSARTLRVSRYLGAAGAERHTRLSVWQNAGEAEAAISLDDEEALRLSAFLTCGEPASAASPRVVRRIVASVRRRMHTGVG